MGNGPEVNEYPPSMQLAAGNLTDISDFTPKAPAQMKRILVPTLAVLTTAAVVLDLHRTGGSVVLTGEPFASPCDPTDSPEARGREG